jgi:hypothetical protein
LLRTSWRLNKPLVVLGHALDQSQAIAQQAANEQPLRVVLERVPDYLAQLAVNRAKLHAGVAGHDRTVAARRGGPCAVEELRASFAAICWETSRSATPGPP